MIAPKNISNDQLKEAASKTRKQRRKSTELFRNNPQHQTMAADKPPLPEEDLQSYISRGLHELNEHHDGADEVCKSI